MALQCAPHFDEMVGLAVVIQRFLVFPNTKGTEVVGIGCIAKELDCQTAGMRHHIAQLAMDEGHELLQRMGAKKHMYDAHDHPKTI